MKVQNVLYKASAQAQGGREGVVEVTESNLKLKLTLPKSLGGNGAEGANPEQLFAAGYSSCFLGALKFVAQKEKVKLSEETSVEGIVGIGPIDTGFGIEVELNINLPGIDKDFGEQLIAKAHIVCPYSNATQGNINVKLNLI